jgi:hypothetical protein
MQRIKSIIGSDTVIIIFNWILATILIPGWSLWVFAHSWKIIGGSNVIKTFPVFIANSTCRKNIVGNCKYAELNNCWLAIFKVTQGILRKNGGDISSIWIDGYILGAILVVKKLPGTAYFYWDTDILVAIVWVKVPFTATSVAWSTKGRKHQHKHLAHIPTGV